MGAFCRQTGKSMTISILAILEALRKPNGRIVIVGPNDRQAGLLFEKVILHVKDSPVASEVLSFTKREMIMKNGCVIKSLPCGDTGDNIRGETADVLILEEAAFIKDSIVQSVLLPMVATGGKMIKISTPFGMNHFYGSYTNDTWIKHRYTWKDAVEAGHFTEEFVEEQRKTCTEMQFRTEMEAEFIADEDAYFKDALIQSCIDMSLENDYSADSTSTYYLGVDIARMGEDSSVFTVVKKGPVNVVQYIEEIPKNTMDEAIQKIANMHGHFRFSKMFMDETGLGAGVTDILAKQYNSNKKSINLATYAQTYASMDVVVGVTFTVKNKMDIYNKLKLLMEQGKIKIPNNEKLIWQLKDFRYEKMDGSIGNLKLHHSHGGRDDYCDALALSVAGLRGVEFDYAIVDFKEEAGIEF